MINIEISQYPDSSWNKRLMNTEFGAYCQTTEFAKYVKLHRKVQPKFVKFFTESDELVGQLLLFQYNKGQKRLGEKIGRGKLFSHVVKLLRFLPKSCYWSHGPIIFNLNYTNDIFDLLGNYLLKSNFKFQCTSHTLNSNFKFSNSFNFKSKDNHTFIINLQDNIDQIFKNTEKNSVQKNISRSKERGVKITQINSHDDILVYYNILKKFRKDNDLPPYYYDDVVTGFKITKEAGVKGFLAWHDDLPVGGIIITTFNGYINESGIARTQKDYDEKLYSLELLRWKIIEWGIENKCKYYDLSGVEINNNDPKKLGIHRNKKKWGGKLVAYSSWFN